MHMWIDDDSGARLRITLPDGEEYFSATFAEVGILGLYAPDGELFRFIWQPPALEDEPLPRRRAARVIVEDISAQAWAEADAVWGTLEKGP